MTPFPYKKCRSHSFDNAFLKRNVRYLLKKIDIFQKK